MTFTSRMSSAVKSSVRRSDFEKDTVKIRRRLLGTECVIPHVCGLRVEVPHFQLKLLKENSLRFSPPLYGGVHGVSNRFGIVRSELFWSNSL